jgi:hypothetical protein
LDQTGDDFLMGAQQQAGKILYALQVGNGSHFEQQTFN